MKYLCQQIILNSSLQVGIMERKSKIYISNIGGIVFFEHLKLYYFRFIDFVKNRNPKKNELKARFFLVFEI